MQVQAHEEGDVCQLPGGLLPGGTQVQIRAVRTGGARNVVWGGEIPSLRWLWSLQGQGQGHKGSELTKPHTQAVLLAAGAAAGGQGTALVPTEVPVPAAGHP